MNQFSFLISMNKQQRRRGMVAAGLAGVAIMVFTAAAGASPIRFDNPAGAGHFDWRPEIGNNFDVEYLDITLPSESQPLAFGGPSEVGQQWLDEGNGRTRLWSGSSSGKPLMEVGGFGGFFILAHDAGDMFPTGAPVDDYGWIFHDLGSPPTEFTIGQEAYVAVQISGTGQNGWIGVVMDANHQFDAFAWGYETEPGVPIPAGVPEPGSLALLATGLIGLLCYAWRKRTCPNFFKEGLS